MGATVAHQCCSSQLRRQSLEENLEHSPLVTLLVTGRRGPFPSYRVNGLYQFCDDDWCDSQLGPDPKEFDNARNLRFNRLDRPEVSMTCSNVKDLQTSSQCQAWHCEIKKELIAVAHRQDEQEPIEFNMCDGKGKYLKDPDVIMALFRAPVNPPKSPRVLSGKLKGSRSWPWERRALVDLCPPL